MSSSSPTAQRAPEAIILAAGRGTRMGGGDKPKVVYPVADRPMVAWVVEACQRAGVSRCVVVVGFRADLVIESLKGFRNVEFAEQKELLGTGHAVMAAAPAFANRPATDVFVLAGDGPLIRDQTLKQLLAVHRSSNASSTLATAILDDPTGYGRVHRHADGSFKAIIEQKDSTPEQLKVREVNPSYYCFRSDRLFEALPKLKTNNKQGEYYLTDVPSLHRDSGQTVALVDAVPAEDVLSINTLEQLAVVDSIMRNRLSTASSNDSSRHTGAVKNSGVSQ